MRIHEYALDCAVSEAELWPAASFCMIKDHLKLCNIADKIPRKMTLI